MTERIKEELNWPELRRVRRAIVVVDVVESVRLMQAHPSDVIDRWRRFVHEVRSDVLPHLGGRMVKSLGDGMLLEFDHVADAVRAALGMQPHIDTLNIGRASEAQIWLRCGVHVGDVVVDTLDIFGPAVNLTARLAGLAQPGEVAASAEVRDLITPAIDADVEDLGECYFKHVDTPVRSFRLRRATAPEAPQVNRRTQPVDDLYPVVAVLPFSCRQAADSDGALGDALADDLIAALSRRRDWRVVSRLSTAAFRGPDTMLQAVRAVLGATFVVRGSFTAPSEGTQVRMEVTDTRSGHILWSDGGYLPLAEFFAGEDRVIATFVARIAAAIDGAELRRVGALPMPNLESYTLYLGGTNLLNRLGQRDFNRSRDILTHVCERVPRAAAPHAMLAKWHVMRMTQGWTRDAFAEGLAARACANRALQLESHHAYALAVDGLVAAQVDGNLALARERYEAAIAADPQEPYAWAALSGVLAYGDEAQAAVDAARRAITLSPLDPARFMFESYLAVALVHAGKHDAAIEAAQASLRLNRCLTASYRILAVAQVLCGQSEHARDTVASLMALEPSQTLAGFQRRYPGRDSRSMPVFLDALRQAGVPD